MSRDCGEVACVRPELLPGRCGGGPRQGTRGCKGGESGLCDVACVSPELLPRRGQDTAGGCVRSGHIYNSGC